MAEESFYRPSELGREPRSLPARTYNMARRLMLRADTDCVFVPIRSMQYLAILDAEEFVFVPRYSARTIEIAWQNFAPAGRDRLDAPVPYDAVYYGEESCEVMKRLQMDFTRALEELERKRQTRVKSLPHRVLRFPGREES